jgi:dihydrofolate reductase
MAKRRNVIVHIATSADGYIARPDGDLEWLTSRPAPEGFYGMNAFMRSIDTTLLGRKSYEDIWLMGGGDLIASFLDEQAIDEFVISVVPVFIGDGIPLIARRHRHVPLDLHSIERFEDGLVQLHYRVQDHS